MTSLIARISLFGSLTASAPLARGAGSLARTLMEQAHAGAGRNPQQARELRRAACAYLSVVR